MRVLDNFSSSTRRNLDRFRNRIDVVEGDVRSLSTCRSAMKDVRHVVHLAAQISVVRSLEEPYENDQTNVIGTLNLLECSRTQKLFSFLFASSSSVYGDHSTPPLSEDALPRPLSPYAISKLTGEYFMRLYAELYGVPTCSFRFFNVFGPRQDPQSSYAAVIPVFVDCALRKHVATVFGDGEQTRDFIFVSDVVNGLIHASDQISHFSGKVLNFCSGVQTSINSIHDLISKLSGIRIPPRYEKPRAGEIRHSMGSTTRLCETWSQTGSSLARVPLEEALKMTWASYQN